MMDRNASWYLNALPVQHAVNAGANFYSKSARPILLDLSRESLSVFRSFPEQLSIVLGRNWFPFETCHLQRVPHYEVAYPSL